MSTPFLTVGCKLMPYGGHTIPNNRQTFVDGKNVVCLGDRAMCNKHGLVKAVGGPYDPTTIIDGSPLALDGCKFSCGCIGLANQSRVVANNYSRGTLTERARAATLPAQSAYTTSNLTNNQPNELNGYYYNVNTGVFEGNITKGQGNLTDVFACSGKSSPEQFTEPKKVNISHIEFQKCAYVVQHESHSAGLECIYIAFTANNYAKQVKQSLYQLLMSSYSSVPTKIALSDTDINDKSKDARKGVLQAILGMPDPTHGATHWDGTDFFAWGLQSPYKDKKGNNKPHAKFREYKKISISKEIYDAVITETLKEYPSKSIRYNGVRYNIPAAVFQDKNNWINGNFEYITGAKSPKTLTAMVTAGHTIFWKAQ